MISQKLYWCLERHLDPTIHMSLIQIIPISRPFGGAPPHSVEEHGTRSRTSGANVGYSLKDAHLHTVVGPDGHEQDF